VLKTYHTCHRVLFNTLRYQCKTKFGFFCVQKNYFINRLYQVGSFNAMGNETSNIPACPNGN
jgi:hypothetical protein